MHIMLGFLHALARQHAFALFVDLEHVKLRLFSCPAEDLLKDVRHIIHIVHRVIPANDQVTRLKLGVSFFLRFLNRAGYGFRYSSLNHNPRLEDKLELVEGREGQRAEVRGQASEEIQTVCGSKLAWAMTEIYDTIL